MYIKGKSSSLHLLLLLFLPSSYNDVGNDLSIQLIGSNEKEIIGSKYS